MDNNLTLEIKSYLEQKPEERDLLKGAEMVLKLNRNRILFQNIIRKPENFSDKIEYELKKFFKIRLDQKTADDVIAMQKKVIPAAEETISSHSDDIVVSTDNDVPSSPTIANGKRKDHDSLPDDVKALWDSNAGLYFKIKDLFEQLKGMSDAPACDRYEYLKLLDECDKQYRQNLAQYDSFNSDENVTVESSESNDASDIVKKVNAARKFISSNKDKLAALKNSDDNESYKLLLAKMQDRFDYLISTGNGIDAQQLTELYDLGIKAS